MKRRSVVRTVILVYLVASLPVAARAESAREILDRARAVNEAREPRDTTQRLKMTLVNSNGSVRVRELKAYSKTYKDNTNKSLTLFLSPVEVRGVAFLAWSYPNREDDQWLYFPKTKRVRRISAGARRGSFQGSDFSYEDLELLNEIQDWTENDAASELVKEADPVDGVSCAVIGLIPKEKDLKYGRIVIWLNREDATVRRMDLYDKEDGALSKTLLLSDFRTVDAIPTQHRIEMANVQKGTKTVMETSEIRYNAGLDDSIFTERSLKLEKVN